MKLGEAMYRQSQGEEDAAARRRRRSCPVRKSDDGVVDADFEEVGDDDRKSA